jgi:carbamoyltransferase
VRILGINALYHDPSAALVVDGRIVAAAEEERFSRRKHGKRPVPFSAWELPELSSAWCLERGGLRADELDLVTYSFDPALHESAAELGVSDPWDWLRLEYATRAPEFLATALPGLDPSQVRFVPHHVAHAASAGLAAPFGQDCAVLVLDGRGERHSHLAGRFTRDRLDILASQRLPHSLGLLYEDATEHLGFLRSSDEYKVMALASYGKPKHLGYLRELVHATADGGFRTSGVDWNVMAKRREPPEDWTVEHADLAASLQAVLEETVLDLVTWLYEQTGSDRLALAGGVALNCVANGKVLRDGTIDALWVQPAAGDAGGALGAALAAYHEFLDQPRRVGNVLDGMQGAYLGPGFTTAEIAERLLSAGAVFKIVEDEAVIGQTVDALAEEKAVGWFQGRMEFGPRALGARSILGDPRSPQMQRQLNLKVKFRESFRPFAPSVLREDVAEWFELDDDSPYMLVVADVLEDRRRPVSEEDKKLFGIDRLNTIRSEIPAVTHVDMSARIQTVHKETNPRYHALLSAFKERTGCPVLVNTSFNVRSEPIVCTPEDAFRCFMGTDIDLLVAGNCVARKEDQDPSLRVDYKGMFEPD